MYKVGFIDEDIHEVRKFERKFENHFQLVTFQISKGLTKESLIEEVYKADVDLLLVDYLMSDKGILTYNGDEIVRDFEKIKPRFPMIIFTNNETDAFPHVDNPNIIYDKKLATDRADHFINIINKNIELYRNYISEKKEKIESLISKRDSLGLDAKEKDELFSLQIDLNNLDSRIKETPSHLVTDLKLDILKDATKNAETLLNSLLNKPD